MKHSQTSREVGRYPHTHTCPACSLPNLPRHMLKDLAQLRIRGEAEPERTTAVQRHAQPTVPHGLVRMVIYCDTDH